MLISKQLKRRYMAERTDGVRLAVPSPAPPPPPPPPPHLPYTESQAYATNNACSQVAKTCRNLGNQPYSASLGFMRINIAPGQLEPNAPLSPHPRIMSVHMIPVTSTLCLETRGHAATEIHRTVDAHRSLIEQQPVVNGLLGPVCTVRDHRCTAISRYRHHSIHLIWQ